MIMINAIADAKTGRSMKKFMTQINSMVGAGDFKHAESSTNRRLIIAARFLSGRREWKSCRKTRVSHSTCNLDVRADKKLLRALVGQLGPSRGSLTGCRRRPLGHCNPFAHSCIALGRLQAGNCSMRVAQWCADCQEECGRDMAGVFVPDQAQCSGSDSVQARISVSTRPCTSVSRKSRPPYR